MKTVCTHAAALGCALLLAAPSAQAEGSSFHEEFDELGSARWYVSDGWTNGAHQNCEWRRENASVESGTLRLRYGPNADGLKTDRSFACAEVQTKERFGYGTYEVRMRAVDRSGFNSAFFSYIGPSDKQPHDEIDFEVLGKDAARVQLNRYVDGVGGHETFAAVPGGAATAFHDYAYVWEPGRLRWYVDGRLVHETDDAATIPTRPMKIFVSFWASETNPAWLGAFAAPGSEPLSVDVDWLAYTAPGETCLFPASLTCAKQ